MMMVMVCVSTGGTCWADQGTATVHHLLQDASCRRPAEDNGTLCPVSQQYLNLSLTTTTTTSITTTTTTTTTTTVIVRLLFMCVDEMSQVLWTVWNGSVCVCVCRVDLIWKFEKEEDFRWMDGWMEWCWCMCVCVVNTVSSYIRQCGEFKWSGRVEWWVLDVVCGVRQCGKHEKAAGRRYQ